MSDKCTFADVRTLLQANLTAAVITVAAANTSALTSTGYSLTGSDATSMVDLAGTWNTTGTPTALKLNVTNTASNAASLLMDIQLGGASLFNLRRDGTVLLDQANSKVYFSNTNIYVGEGSGGVTLGYVADMLSCSTLGARVHSGYLRLVNTYLYQDAANILAQRNSTTAQAFRVYSTWTNASNGSWMTLDAAKTTANVNRIISNANGTGTIRPIAIDAYAMAGAPTTSELPSGTWGVFKDSSGGSPGNVVIAYNDEGNILTASLA